MSKAKGRRTSKDAIDWLENNDWIVDECEQGGRFRKFKDLFAGYCLNCLQRKDECCKKPKRFSGFDAVALHKKKRVVLLLQFKTNQPPTLKEYKKFASCFAGSQIWMWSMTKYDYKGFVIHEFLPNGKVKRRDLRKK